MRARSDEYFFFLSHATAYISHGYEIIFLILEHFAL